MKFLKAKKGNFGFGHLWPKIGTDFGQKIVESST